MGEEFSSWRGDMEADYVYTAGVAGERFLREIRDNERLMGTFCPHCDVIYLPPRIYCETCYRSLDEWEEVPNKGVVAVFTVAHVGADGNPLPRPEVWALVRFSGVRGGLFHRVDLPPEAVEVGMEVEAVFSGEASRGSITDIQHFKPI